MPHPVFPLDGLFPLVQVYAFMELAHRYVGTLFINHASPVFRSGTTALTTLAPEILEAISALSSTTTLTTQTTPTAQFTITARPVLAPIAENASASEAALGWTPNFTWLLLITVLMLLLVLVFASCCSRRKSQPERPEGNLDEDKTKLRMRNVKQEKKCNEEKERLRDEAEKAHEELHPALLQILALLEQKNVLDHAATRPDSRSQSTQTEYFENSLITRLQREIKSLQKERANHQSAQEELENQIKILRYQHLSARADSGRLRKDLEKYSKDQKILENLLASFKIVEQKVNEISETCQLSQLGGEEKGGMNIAPSGHARETIDEHDLPARKESDDAEDANSTCDLKRCHECPWYRGHKHHICANNTPVSVDACTEPTVPESEPAHIQRFASPAFGPGISSRPVNSEGPTASALDTIIERGSDLENPQGGFPADLQQTQEPDPSKPENPFQIIEARRDQLYPRTLARKSRERDILTPDSQPLLKRRRRAETNQLFPSPEIIENTDTKVSEEAAALPSHKTPFDQKPASNTVDPATPISDATVEPELSIVNPEGQPEQPKTPTRPGPLSSSPGSGVSDISSTVPPLPESDDGEVL